MSNDGIEDFDLARLVLPAVDTYPETLDRLELLYVKLKRLREGQERLQRRVAAGRKQVATSLREAMKQELDAEAAAMLQKQLKVVKAAGEAVVEMQAEAAKILDEMHATHEAQRVPIEAAALRWKMNLEPLGWNLADLVDAASSRAALEKLCRQVRGTARAHVASKRLEQAAAVDAPAIAPEAPVEESAASTMEPGPDFETFKWGLKTFDFPRPMQRRCVRVLWEAYKDGRRPLSVETLRERVGSEETAKPSDWFRKHDAWGTLVVTPTQGRYTLQPPETPKL